MRNLIFAVLILTSLVSQALAATAQPARAAAKRETALLFMPHSLRKGIDKNLLARLLKLPSHVSLEESVSQDLEKVLGARQPPASQHANERITTLAVALMRGNIKTSEATRAAQIAEVEQISDQALREGWYGSFLAIRHFVTGIIRSDSRAIQLLFANTEDFSSQFPVELRDTIDLNKAEWLAQVAKLNRGAMRTHIQFSNARDWPQSDFCAYQLNGQPFRATNATVVAGLKHQIVESCVDGTQRHVSFELKPFQREALLAFSDETKRAIEKISTRTWANEFGPRNIHSIVTAVFATESSLLTNIETKTQSTQRELDYNRVREFSSAVEDTSLAAGNLTIEVYPSLWMGGGKNSSVFVEALPAGQIFGLGASVRYSDFSLSLDSGFAGFDDVDTAVWILGRAHWAKEFSFDGLRGVELRPLLGAGAFVVPESITYENIEASEKFYASVGLILSYSISEQTSLAIGSEFCFAWGLLSKDSDRRFLGLSLRTGYQF